MSGRRQTHLADARNRSCVLTARLPNRAIESWRGSYSAAGRRLRLADHPPNGGRSHGPPGAASQRAISRVIVCHAPATPSRRHTFAITSMTAAALPEVAAYGLIQPTSGNSGNSIADLMISRAVDGAQEMVGGNVGVQRELVKQSALLDLQRSRHLLRSLPHHGSKSP